MGKWLSWILGIGNNIEIGIDPIVGGPTMFNLSMDIVDGLHSASIHTLDQVTKVFHKDHICSRWRDVISLRIPEAYMMKWDNYIIGLNRGEFP